MNKQRSHTPENHPFYHNTQKLLRHYRDVAWNLEISSHDMQAEFRAEYGTSLTTCLDALSMVDANLQGTRIESFARSMEKSRKMMQIVDSAILLMRQKHKKGELYYWILYYTYLSPHEYQTSDQILQALCTHLPPMSLRTYYSRREEAVSALSALLWGDTSTDMQEITELFL